jgi:hypothetical protein
MTLAERRGELFALWDECDEATTIGAKARHLIEDFIREVAPAGSAQAYSKPELEELNRRRVSRAAFRPYAGSN